MKVLVTGGAGFIGSHLCDALHARGDDVWCVDNLLLGREANIVQLKGSNRFHFFEADVMDRTSMDPIFKDGGFDVIYHLAANSDIQRGGSDHSVDLNLTFHTTFEILEQAYRHGIKRIFFASTSAVFGETDKLLHEDFGPLRPISFYGASKLAGEAFASVYANNYDITVNILRFPNIVGARATHGAIFDFIRKLKANPAELTVLGDGTQKKPYLLVQELVKAIMLIDRPEKGYFVFHAGPKDLVTVKEMAQIVIQEMNLPHCAIKFTGGDRGWTGDVPTFNYDISKIQRLGWQPAHTSSEAIRLAVRQLLGSSSPTG